MVALESLLQVVTRRAITSLKPDSCFLPHKEESGECYTAHPDPASCRHRPQAGSLCSTSLPGQRSRSLVSVPRSFLVAPTDHQTRLRNSFPPKFSGIWFTSVKAVDAPVLRAEITVLLAKDVIEPVPPADMRLGFYSPYFIVPKKSGGLRPSFDLRVLNRALHKMPFKMLTQKRISGCVHPLD